MSIQQQVQAVRARMAAAAESSGRRPEDIALCAATKVQSDDTIRAAIAPPGITLCGENRVQELTAHLAAGAYEGARVHFIGPPPDQQGQAGGGKGSADHSVDSQRCFRPSTARRGKLGLVQDILLEVNIAGEGEQGGLHAREAEELAALAAGMDHVRLRGLMAIPPISPEPGANRPFFAAMLSAFC